MDNDFAGRVTVTHLAGLLILSLLAIVVPHTKTAVSDIALLRELGSWISSTLQFLIRYFVFFLPLVIFFLSLQYTFFRKLEQRGGQRIFRGWQRISYALYTLSIVLVLLSNPATAP